ncbi:MAG TPA: hypothetical protein VNO55_32730, partial [Polyangia bacterium]|nr:hypothetical protein [Polyangia bacterium]
MKTVLNAPRRRFDRAASVRIVSAFIFLAGVACGSSTPPAGGDANGTGGTSGGSGSGGSGSGGNAGGSGGAGSGTGGSGGSGGSGVDGGGPLGTQPLGAACANSGNCAQTAGAAICCVNTCLLMADCPSNRFLECGPAPDYSCAAFGGGKQCCKATAGGQTMFYCTK